MESRAKYALVGFATLAAVAAFVGFIFWFSSGRGAAKIDAQVIFKDKVSGLSRGSSVLFNGVVVGEVIEIRIRPDDARRVAALIRVDQSTPLRLDTRAQLEAQGFAGVVVVQLLGGDASSAPFGLKAGQPIPTIYAEPSEDIFEKVRRVATSVDDALVGLENFVKNSAGDVNEVVRRGEQFSVELADNSGGVEKLMQSMGAVADFLAPLPQTLSTFSQDLTETLRTVDQKKVAAAIDNVDQFASTLGGIVGEVSVAVKNVASMSQKLNRAADQIEGVLKGAETFLRTAAGQDGRSAFADVSEVANSIRVLAASLDLRSAEITKEIIRFTGGDLGGIKNFATEAHRALTGASRTLRDLDRDPQKLISGSKAQILQYNGTR